MEARAKLELLKAARDEESARSGINMKHAAAEAPAPAGIGPGTVLDGKYFVGDVIGSGAFGIVYEAKNLELDERVALKVMRPEAAADKSMVGRFAREAKSAASIKSEYVATVFDVGSKDGTPYIVMEFLEGKNLGQKVEDEGPLPARNAVEYALQICEALAIAHSKGIIHRDIKPENLLLAERAGGMSIVKVLDFGISKAALTGSIFGNDVPIVKTMNLMGTPLYMSPEQVRCSDHVDVRSDIWSLGMVLYEILAGSTAFEGSSIPEICAAILETTPTPIEVHRNDLPAGLVHVITKCLEKEQSKRFQNVAELAMALMPFGPKRSRLNVERAVSVLQSAGHVDPELKLDSMMPPPSSDVLSGPITGRIVPPNMPTISEIVSAHDASLPSTAAPPDTLGSPGQSGGSSKTKLAIAAGCVVLAIVGAAMLLSSSKTETPPPAPIAAVKPVEPAPAPTHVDDKPAAATPPVEDTHPAAPAATTAHTAPAVPAWARAPKQPATTKPTAAAPPPATTSAPPPATTAAPAAPPAETSTGRTFRRSL